MGTLPAASDLVAHWLGLRGLALDLPVEQVRGVLAENARFRQAWALAELALGAIDEAEVHRRWPGLDVRRALRDPYIKGLAEQIAARRDVQQGAMRAAVARLLPSVLRAVERQAVSSALGARALRDIGELTVRLAALADRPIEPRVNERRLELVAGRARVKTPEHQEGRVLALREEGDVLVLLHLLRLTEPGEVEALRALLAQGTVGGGCVWPGW